MEDGVVVAANGKPLSILWKAPFKVDVTGALTQGSKQMTIEATSLSVNRLICRRRTFTLVQKCKANHD
jgi:hypothetical protein